MESEGVPLQRRRERGGWRAAVSRRLPVLRWGAHYSRGDAAADLVAGVTLGLMLVPQSIAYASLANLPVHYGLYSAYLGTMVYVVLGTVRQVSIGPTSLMALLTLQLCRGLPLQYMLLLTFLSGCIVLVMGLLRLGFLVELISPSVTSGFTSGTAVIIVVSQLKGVLGLSFTAESVPDNARLIVAHWHQLRLPDLLLGLACCTALLLLRKLKDVRVSGKRPRLRKALWLLSIGRNALVVLAAATAAYFLHSPTHPPLFRLSGRVEAGVPPLSLPPFSATFNNRTEGFLAMTARLGPGLLMVPVVMLIANIAIAKAFTEGGRVDATQEMLTLGLVNIAGSFVHAMPTCGAFTRSAVSHSSGVRTPAAGLYSGIITLLALIFLTKYFYFIPKACLSSVLICAVIFMVDCEIVVRLWRRDRGELCVLAGTFVVSVARSVELAVLVGVVASLGALVRRLLRPPLEARALGAPGAAALLRPSAALCYLNAELLAARAGEALAAHRALLLDCVRITVLDYSAAQMLERLAKKAKEEGKSFIVFRCPESIIPTLEGVSGLERRALRAPSVPAALDAAGLPPYKAATDLPLQQAATDLPPQQAATDLPPQQAATDLPPQQASEACALLASGEGLV